MSADSKELSKLWDKACTGDQKAFSAKMYSSVKSMVKDKALTDDILQDTFMKLWSRREAIGKVENVAGYFFAATRSMCLNYIRASEAMELKWESIEVSKFRDPVQSSIEETITERETNLRQKEIVQAALKSLPARQRKIMMLRFNKRLDHNEIGEITGLRYQSVANYLYRAVQTLRMKVRN